MKFMVGLPKNNPEFVDYLIENSNHIYELYFSWGDFPNGRSSFIRNDDYTEWELMDIERSALKKVSDAKIPLNLLFNANCYGKDSQSRSFFNKIGDTIDFVKRSYGLKSVTTTSPLIAKFVKANFSDIEVRASVNMEIGTVQGMKYLSEYFDSFYMKRELNRDFESIKILHKWCSENGKKLFMLANSGCLNFCSAHNFHDNLVAHENDIAKMDNAYNFGGICHEYLKKPENYKTLYDNMNFIRPEDIPCYDSYFEAVKLATRVHNNPTEVLESYIKGKYSGDLLRLLEPAHSIYPYVIENGDKPMLKKIGANIYQEEKL
ncbi:MAG: hypothetical protein IKJ68_00405 [Clostridia bacterium]|nr:hypothetical protein [Clostridia bacterium]